MGRSIFTQGWYDRVEALIALALAKTAAASSGTSTPWVDVAAGTTIAPTQAQKYLSCDSTGPLQSVVNLPASPSNGQEQWIRLTGTTQVTPVIVNAQGAGITVESLTSPGSFVASSFLAIEAMVVGLKYDGAPAVKQWKIVGLSQGAAAGALSAASWTVDYVAGKNSNAGTPAAPLASVAEIRRRWNGGIGGVRPTLPAIAIAVNVLNSAPAAAPFADPLDVLWDLDGSPGLAMVITLTPTVKRAGTIAAVPNAFSRTATGEQTVTDAGVADWTSDVDHLLAVTNHGKQTVCWVTEALAAPARGVLSSAYDQALSVPTAIAFGLVADTVAATDTYNILTQATCYLGGSSQFRIAPGSADSGATGLASVAVVNAHGLAQGANDVLHVEGDGNFATTFTAVGAVVAFVNCQIDQQRQLQGGGVCWFNCFTPSGPLDLLGGPNLLAEQLSGYTRRFSLIHDNMLIDQDFFMVGSIDMNIGDPDGAANGVVLGDVGHFLHGGAAINVFIVSLGSQVVIAPFQNPQAVIYGQTSGNELVNFFEGGNLFSTNATAAATFVTDGGAGAFLSAHGDTNAVFFNIATSTYLPVGGVTATITHIDGARPAALGGTAHWPDRDVHVVFSAA